MVSRLPKEEILITGASGFIGANLAHYLVTKGITPSVIVRRQSNLWRIKNILKKLKLHYVDLRDKQKLDKIISKIRPKVIFHCATYGGFPFQKDFNQIIQTDILGTLNLVHSCIEQGFDCFVNSGTSSEYGIKKKPTKETEVLEPLSDYAAAKASATLFCQALAKRMKLPIVTLRPFSPYGYFEGETRLIPSVILSCLAGRSPELSSPGAVRDFIFIEDVIDAYIKVVENKDRIKGEIINIGYGKQHSVGEIVNKIMNLTQSKIKPLWEVVSNSGIEPSSWVADIRKAEKILNWQPEYDLDSGLKRTISWFKKNLSLYKDKGL